MEKNKWNTPFFTCLQYTYILCLHVSKTVEMFSIIEIVNTINLTLLYCKLCKFKYIYISVLTCFSMAEINTHKINNVRA